jgi:hypothetical protein
MHSGRRSDDGHGDRLPALDEGASARLRRGSSAGVRGGISYPQPRGAYEVDHLIPLELGGDNTIANLWPEAADPVPGFHEKDKVENYLHRQVCSGAMGLTDAQRQIASDWLKVWKQIEVQTGAAVVGSDESE